MSRVGLLPAWPIRGKRRCDVPLRTKLSVVLPVRDGQGRIVAEVERILEALSDLSRDASEVIVVDDGSRDATPEILDELRARYPQVRVARHGRPRGFEAAGQTGLEKATGDLIFIQETPEPVRLEDLQRLYRMSDDASVVAARAESTPQPLRGPLLRRLRAWGARAEAAAEARDAATTESQARHSGLQMVRRPHLQQLAGPAGKNLQLQADRYTSTSVSSI